MTFYRVPVSRLQFFAVLLVECVIGCSKPETDNDQAAVDEIKKQTQQFEDGFNARNIDQIMEFYADDYVDINLPEPRQTKSERRQLYQRILDQNLYTLRVVPAEIIISGTHAFVRGDIILKRDSAEQKLRYLEICKKGQDSKWRSIWGLDADIYPESRIEAEK
ncbi:MAG TPA: nuclear transport factor 2 family protein [Cyclobacteriaceae bacterium]|nr:nuclear transport factor 2 family protein [Cyclobacteriaceae bacterium]